MASKESTSNRIPAYVDPPRSARVETEVEQPPEVLKWEQRRHNKVRYFATAVAWGLAVATGLLLIGLTMDSRWTSFTLTSLDIAVAAGLAGVAVIVAAMRMARAPRPMGLGLPATAQLTPGARLAWPGRDAIMTLILLAVIVGGLVGGKGCRDIVWDVVSVALRRDVRKDTTSPPTPQFQPGSFGDLREIGKPEATPGQPAIPPQELQRRKLLAEANRHVIGMYEVNDNGDPDTATGDRRTLWHPKNVQAFYAEVRQLLSIPNYGFDANDPEFANSQKGGDPETIDARFTKRIRAIVDQEEAFETWLLQNHPDQAGWVTIKRQERQREEKRKRESEQQ